MRRWLFFFLFIFIGFAAGLFYARQINPLRYQDASLRVLSAEFQTDYVLMVAEVYSLLGDQAIAARRLADLGDEHPLEVLRRAILFAEQAGYNDLDLQKMRDLQVSLEALIAPLGTPLP